jgi:hypothetical protein
MAMSRVPLAPLVSMSVSFFLNNNNNNIQHHNNNLLLLLLSPWLFLCLLLVSTQLLF